MTLSSGIHRDVPMSVYLADPCEAPSLNPSLAHVLDRQSPAHVQYQHPRLNPEYVAPTSEAFELGTAIHHYVLGGEARVVVIPADDYKKKEAQLARDEARKAGKLPMLTGQFLAVQRIAARVRDYLDQLRPAPPKELWSEVTLVWEEAGVWCRTRPDLLASDASLVLDLKSTSGSAHPWDYARKLYDYGFDLKLAWALRGLRRLKPDARPEASLVVVETDPPYAITRVVLDPESAHAAQEKADVLIDEWRTLMREPAAPWPGYDSRVHTIEMPPYERLRWELRQFAR